MEICIGENIRRLRKERNLTQESLAEILCISPQSVSKWERGEAFPDIVMLPAIANYFGITVDVLLGNDKILAEQKILAYLDDYRQKTSGGTTWAKREEILEFARKAYREFSYDFRIMMLYVNALNVYGTDSEQYRGEILSICRLVLQNCDDPSLCADASYYICGFRTAKDRLAFLKKYIEYGQDWNWFKVYPRDSEEGKIMMQHEISDAWWHLNVYIWSYADLDNDTSSVAPEEKIRFLRKCEAIFYAFFDDDDFGEYVFYIGQYNEFLAREYFRLGMPEEGLTCFEKSVDGWIVYDSLPKEYVYKNILIDHRPYDWDGLCIGDGKDLDFYRKRIDDDPVYDIVRGNKRFCTAYKKLIQTRV